MQLFVYGNTLPHYYRSLYAVRLCGSKGGVLSVLIDRALGLYSYTGI